MHTERKRLSEDRANQIVDALLELEYDRFLEEIKPAISLLKNKGYTPRELFEKMIQRDSFVTFINEFKMRLIGVDGNSLTEKLNENERIYLSALLFIKNNYFSPVFSSIIYEIARAGNLIKEENKSSFRMRATIAKNILDELVEKGILKKIQTDDEIKKVKPILKYTYDFVNGKLLPKISQLYEYKQLEINKKKIEEDERVRTLFNRYNKVIKIFKERQTGR